MKTARPLQRKTPLRAKPKPRAQRLVLPKLPPLSEVNAPGVSLRIEGALFPKRPRKSKPNRPATTTLRKSAKGEACTLNIAGVCKYESETVVLCHLPFLSDLVGMAQKADDICACYGCRPCHDRIDGRDGVVMAAAEKYFYGARALVRTLIRMAANGLVVIKGATT